MQKENRRNQRLKIALDVEYIVEGSQEPWRGRIYDLSAGGAGLVLAGDIRPGAIFASVRFLLPGDKGVGPLTIDTQAEAVHSIEQQDADGRTWWRVGIRFEGLPEETRRRIQQFVYLRLLQEETAPAWPLGRRRVPFEQAIAVRFERFDSFVTEMSANMSEAGMFITAAKSRPPGSVFEFQFTLGEEFTLIEGEAEVVWVRRQSEGPEKPAGMGIRFRRLDDDSRAVIRRMVNRYIADGHAPFDLEDAAPGEPEPTPIAPEEASGVPGSQEAAGIAGPDVDAPVEERTEAGRPADAEALLSQSEAEPTDEADEEASRLLHECHELKVKLQTAVAELASVRSAEAKCRVRLKEASEIEAALRQEVKRAAALGAELGNELLTLQEAKKTSRLEPDRQRGRLVLRDAGLLAAGAVLGAISLFYASSLRLSWWSMGDGNGERAGVSRQGQPAASETIAGPPSTAPPIRKTMDPDSESVRDAVRAWAAAWSEQQVDEYLSFYARDFEPPGSVARDVWESRRRQRIEQPSWVRVTLGPLDQVAVDTDHIRISFGQTYETASYKDSVRKTLDLVWEEGAWKILDEQVASD